MKNTILTLIIILSTGFGFSQNALMVAEKDGGDTKTVLNKQTKKINNLFSKGNKALSKGTTFILKTVKDTNYKINRKLMDDKMKCQDPVPGIWDEGVNDGEGGQVWTQNCSTKVLGKTTVLVHTFTTDIPFKS